MTIDTKGLRERDAWQCLERDDVLVLCDEIDALRQRVFDLEKSEGQLRGKIHELEWALLTARGQGRMR